MPTYYQEPEEMGEPSTPRRADTQVFPASSTESSDDEYMTASMPNIPIGSYPSGLVGPVGPAAGQPLGGPAVNAAVAGVASMSYAPPAQSPLEAREPVPGVLTRRNGFYARTSQDQSALYEVPNPGALTRVATELSALTSDGGPVRRGSVELDLSPSRRLTPQEREISAQNAGFYNYDQLKSVLEKAWEYVPPKVETGGNFISVIGALVENKPTEIAGAALTTATAFAGLINATRERDYERAALHLGNLGVGGINAYNVHAQLKPLAAVSGFAAIGLNSWEGHIDGRQQARQEALRRDLERRGSGTVEPSGSQSQPDASSSAFQHRLHRTDTRATRRGGRS
ncbi:MULTISPECIES: hypothetical protein [Micromonospora]|uniref:hypothetical protein n=1 Tax=Micromonospora TaxID=1873 RepID=UPI00166A13A6|nr:hypothetical protein [Micromonospora yangpuensis]GGM20638.1 hypothetical protein GCM10012279_43800 [Micromonospora yangpuensis]